MLMNKPQPQILIIWRLMLLTASLVPALLISLVLRIGSVAWILAEGIFALIFLAFYLGYLPMLLKNMSFAIQNGRLVVTTGVFSTRVIALPVSAIHFVSVTQSVFARMLGLYTVVAVTPGAKLRVYGLKSGDADKLALALKNDSV